MYVSVWHTLAPNHHYCHSHVHKQFEKSNPTNQVSSMTHSRYFDLSLFGNKNYMNNWLIDIQWSGSFVNCVLRLASPFSGILVWTLHISKFATLMGFFPPCIYFRWRNFFKTRVVIHNAVNCTCEKCVRHDTLWWWSMISIDILKFPYTIQRKWVVEQLSSFISYCSAVLGCGFLLFITFHKTKATNAVTVSNEMIILMIASLLLSVLGPSLLAPWYAELFVTSTSWAL